MHKLKCPICNGCLDFTWITPDPTRYLFCAFCRTYYTEQNKVFTEVPDPHIKKEEV